MGTAITSELVEAYSLCPRKAFLLLTGAVHRQPHDYELVLREQAEANRQAHQDHLAKTADLAPFIERVDLATGQDVFADAELTAADLQARCDFLKRVSGPSRSGSHVYEPVKILGTCGTARTDLLGLAYQAAISRAAPEDSLPSPFRPVAVAPAWMTTTVRQLAQALYEDRQFVDLPILADALEEANCTDVDVLTHCRGPGPHVRGCWVVDLILAKDR